MSEIPIENRGRNPRYVGTICILPGETRFVDEQLLPKPAAPPSTVEQAVAEFEDDTIEILLAGKVRDIIKALPTLDDADFTRLVRLESESEKPRTTLMNAFIEAELERAAAATAAEAPGD